VSEIEHDFTGPRLVPVHVSAVFLKPAADSERVSAPVADPPEFVSLNVWPLVVTPALTGP
jgi:hypothetical protein